MSLTKRVKELEDKIIELEALLKNNTNDISSKEPYPYSKVGSSTKREEMSAVNFGAWASVKNGGVIWNDSILNKPALNVCPPDATKGFNCHSHGRYSGGALDINTVEFVEYNVDWNTETNYNKDCQDWWANKNIGTTLGFTPPISIEQNVKGENVEKVGKLALTFNVNTQQWGVATYEIDVEKCYLVKRRTEANKDDYGDSIAGEDVGDIEKDASGNEMKAPLYVTKEDGTIDTNKTNIVWDTTAKCWRFYAVYKD